jgi:hypothetical protein
MRRRARNPARRLRAAVERLPRHTREAMLRGIDSNRVIVGAYVDPRSGGVCPMLAAHRNGGRTSVASFARAWDEFTGARRPRRATRREVRVLRDLLTQSLGADDSLDNLSIAEIAAQIRAERAELAACRAADPAGATDTDADRAPKTAADLADAERLANAIRIRRRQRRRPQKDVLAAADEQLRERL